MVTAVRWGRVAAALGNQKGGRRLVLGNQKGRRHLVLGNQKGDRKTEGRKIV